MNKDTQTYLLIGCTLLVIMYCVSRNTSQEVDPYVRLVRNKQITHDKIVSVLDDMVSRNITFYDENLYKKHYKSWTLNVTKKHQIDEIILPVTNVLSTKTMQTFRPHDIITVDEQTNDYGQKRFIIRTFVMRNDNMSYILEMVYVKTKNTSEYQLLRLPDLPTEKGELSNASIPHVWNASGKQMPSTARNKWILTDNAKNMARNVNGYPCNSQSDTWNEAGVLENMTQNCENNCHGMNPSTTKHVAMPSGTPGLAYMPDPNKRMFAMDQGLPNHPRA